MAYEVIQVDPATWRIENNGVRFFVLAGSERALVIDTGMTTDNAKEIARSLTALPLLLLNTHADVDHIAGNDAFETALMHPAEYVNYFQKGAAHPVPTPVQDGEVIDLGDRAVRIILQPGHTPGSIAVLDESRRVLFSADSIQTGSIFLFGPMRNRYAYRQSLERIRDMRDAFDEIFPSHGDLPLTPDVISALIRDTDRILSGEEPSVKKIQFGMPVRVYRMDSATFVLDETETD